MQNRQNKIYELKERIIKIIKEYDDQGIHRTGTNVDNNSAQWLANEIEKLGLKPKLEGFQFKNIEIDEASLEINNNKIDGLPLYDSTLPGEEIIKGKLGTLKEEYKIGISRVNNETIRRYNKLRRSNKHLGLIFITEGRTPGLSLINAEFFQESFGPPTLQISSEYWSWITSNIGKEAILTFKIKKVDSEAFNIVTRLNCEYNNLNPMVIMTPRSGWWNCASERAGGIAIFLEIMRDFCINKLKRDVIFLATSGHELGHLGLFHYLKRNPSLLEFASCWLHLGANLAASPQRDNNNRVIPTIMIQSSNSEIESLSLKVLKNSKITPKLSIPGERRPWGEVKNIFEGGGQYFSIIDTYNQYFHHPDDKWPSAVNINKTVEIANALITISTQLTNLKK
ncbi:MAG: hypothetical protein ACFFCD_14905 [Promethearchaeota archaeon]